MKPIIKKSSRQTDRRIDGLSFKAFEEEFGFKPVSYTHLTLPTILLV